MRWLCWSIPLTKMRWIWLEEASMMGRLNESMMILLRGQQSSWPEVSQIIIIFTFQSVLVMLLMCLPAWGLSIWLLGISTRFSSLSISFWIAIDYEGFLSSRLFFILSELTRELPMFLLDWSKIGIILVSILIISVSRYLRLVLLGFLS